MSKRTITYLALAAGWLAAGAFVFYAPKILPQTAATTQTDCHITAEGKLLCKGGDQDGITVQALRAANNFTGANNFDDYSDCGSNKAALTGNWQPILTAPRDGTIIEILNSYGAAPTYSINKWDGNIWKDAQGKPTFPCNQCLFWRPFTDDPSKYVDPTNGAQETVAYWCAAEHVPYDPVTDACTPPGWKPAAPHPGKKSANVDDRYMMPLSKDSLVEPDPRRMHPGKTKEICAAEGKDYDPQQSPPGCVVRKQCAKGEYLSQDGRCLHDQTGEHRPAGDGCNGCTCSDPACHSMVCTAMGCGHGDDPALVIPQASTALQSQTTALRSQTWGVAIVSPSGVFANAPTTAFADPCVYPSVLTANGRCHSRSTISAPKALSCYLGYKDNRRTVVVYCSWKP